MKLLIAVALLVTIIVTCESKRHDEYNIAKRPSIHMQVKTHHHKRSRMRGKHMDLTEGSVPSIHDEWKKISKEKKCQLQCGHKEFCISNPKTGEEKCIGKRNFKESRRLFRSFHKQKKMHKMDLNFDLLDKDLTKVEHVKDVYDLINDYNKFEKRMGKKINVKTDLAKGQERVITEAAEGSTEECRPTELYELRKRMVGWFALMHTESRRDHHRMKHQKHQMGRGHKHQDIYGFIGHKHHDIHGFMGRKRLDTHSVNMLDMKNGDFKKSLLTKRSVYDTVDTESHHHCKCSRSAMWEFHRQDTDLNKILSHEEIDTIVSNRREPCIKPLFKSCDTDSDGALTHGEWCCCMAYTIPPCLEKKRVTDPKEWIPRCDKEGFYEREQCHDKSGCWCVDLNGNEIVGTKSMGSAHCGRYDPNGRLDKKIEIN